MSDSIKQIQNIIDKCPDKKLVFFGGAGVSTESGIPDFRSADGLYNQKYKFPPEMLISHDFFVERTPDFFEYYLDKLIPPAECKPNACHIGLNKLEKKGKLDAVITQNIDGLHQAAGSKRVLELHGSVHRNYCLTCHKKFNAEEICELAKQSDDGVPRCNNGSCNGVIKPDVVLYQEPLDENIMHQSISSIANAHTLIIAGTSLAVYPAAGLVNYFRGKNLVIINKSTTNQDKNADLCINDGVAKVFFQLQL